MEDTGIDSLSLSVLKDSISLSPVKSPPSTHTTPIKEQQSLPTAAPSPREDGTDGASFDLSVLRGEDLNRSLGRQSSVGSDAFYDSICSAPGDLILGMEDREQELENEQGCHPIGDAQGVENYSTPRESEEGSGVVDEAVTEGDDVMMEVVADVAEVAAEVDDAVDGGVESVIAGVEQVALTELEEEKEGQVVMAASSWNESDASDDCAAPLAAAAAAPAMHEKQENPPLARK
ncbi:unnamed protein product, partial [Chrysoparadoxa australica]